MRFTTFIKIFLALAVASWVAGCAGFRRNPVQIASRPVRIGSVAFVDAALGFVLVDAGSYFTPETGQALKTYSGERESGVLSVAPERKPPFVCADIVKGNPAQGDDVFQ